jgi:Holliday junction resolvase-like predicted endonuclease
MDKKHRGAHSELIATTYLLSLGYDVFRNVSAHGLADLIAVNYETGEKVLIDVKSSISGAYKTSDGREVPYERVTAKGSPEQEKAGVKLLHVLRNSECVWQDDE